MDDVGSLGFSLFLLVVLSSINFCEATWSLFSLPAAALSGFDVVLFVPGVSLEFSVICLMELQNCSKNKIFQAKVE